MLASDLDIIIRYEVALMVAPWRIGLVQQIDDLGRWLQGRVALDPDPSEELVPAKDFLDPARLRAAIQRAASTTAHYPPVGGVPAPATGSAEEIDLRVAISRFTRHYCAALTAIALVGLSRGLGVNLSADRCTMIVRHNIPWCVVLDASDEDVWGCAERRAPWPVSGPIVDTMDELRSRVWKWLYAENFWPLFEQTLRLGGLSPALVWSNAAEWVGVVSDAAVEYLDPDVADPITAECRAVLDAATLPGVPEDANPLADKLEWLPGDGQGFPALVQTRKHCCLTYLLADRLGRLCQSCPYLPPADRIALVRERHGVPMGSAGGAAERRAVERGLDRPSTRRLLKQDTRD